MMLKIGEFSKVGKTTIKTLRYYDDIGLFKPSFVDENGYRYYNIEQLKDLLKIIELRSFDLPIEKILEIFNGKDEKDILIEHLKYLENEKKKKSNQIASLKRILKGETNNMEFKSQIKTIEQNIVYFRHGVIPSMENMFDFILEAGANCQKLNPTLKCKNYCYVTYSANEYKEKDVELEYVEAVEEQGNDGNGIKFRVDPSIKALCVEVQGPYTKLASGYDFALNEIRTIGLKITGPIREVYIHGCWDQDDESKYLTEIQIPIE